MLALTVCLAVSPSDGVAEEPDRSGGALVFADDGARSIVLPDDEELRSLDSFTAEFLIRPESLSSAVLMMKTGNWNRDGFHLRLDEKKRLAFSVARDQGPIDEMWIKDTDRADVSNAVDLSGAYEGFIKVEHDPSMDALTSFEIAAEVKFRKLGNRGFLSKTKDWRSDGFFFYLENERIFFGVGNDRPQDEPAHIEASDPIVADRWYSIRAVKRGERARLFIDGELAGEAVVPMEAGPSAANIYMGDDKQLGLQVRELELTRLNDDQEQEPLIIFDFEEGGGAVLQNGVGDRPDGLITIKQAALRTPPNALVDGEWQHVVLRKGETRSTFYIDGKEVADAPTPSDIVDARVPILLGTDHHFPDVQIKEFRLWRQPLTPQEIDAFDVDRTDPPADILAWLDFRNGEGEMAKDIGKAGRDARIYANGSPWLIASGDDDGAGRTSAEEPGESEEAKAAKGADRATHDAAAQAENIAQGSGLIKAPTDARYRISIPVGKGSLVQVERIAADVVVADPNVANVRILAPKLIYVFGNGLGRTDIYVLDSSQSPLAEIEVNVTPDAEAATEALEAAQPETDAEVEAALGGLTASGVVKDAAEARDLAALNANLETPDLPIENNTTIAGSQQVNIRVRFAEVSRSDVFRLGLNWRALFETGNFLFGLTSGQIFQAAGGSDEIDIPFGNTGSIGYRGGDVNVDLLIDALQQEGVIRVLAEPNLTTVNGEEATFLAGGEVPIPVPGGDNGVTIDFKPFGVSLDFTPTILPDERINLRVRPEVSDLIAAGGVLLEGFSIPAFSVRRTDTSVELSSGQTFAIAGLFQRNITDSVDAFPGLGSLPILGSLFTSKRYQRSETELVILITPYLVEPEGGHALSAPGGKGTKRTVRASHKPSPPRPIGPAGFILN